MRIAAGCKGGQPGGRGGGGGQMTKPSLIAANQSDCDMLSCPGCEAGSAAMRKTPGLR